MLLTAADRDHVKLFIILALTTAARSTAILQLEWRRIDLTRRILDFSRSDIPSPVNKGRAKVPINDRLYKALTVAQARSVTGHVIEYSGKPVKSVKKGFAAAVKRAGLVSVSPHTLRHTAASWMAIDGIPIEEIARYLGHTNTSTTWKTYAHFNPEYLKGAIESLDW